MDRGFFKQIRRVLLAETFLSGATSLSKVFSETEDELEGVIDYIGKKAKTQKVFDEKFFKK